MSFRIYDVTLALGLVGLCPLPGRFSPMAEDLETVRAWGPSIVVSLTELPEMARHGAENLGSLLGAQEVEWAHLSIADYGTPADESARAWPVLSQRLHAVLDSDGRVLVHCFGGLGRSGTIALRLMVERGEHPADALKRLRTVRPGAVETDAQYAWAATGYKT